MSSHDSIQTEAAPTQREVGKRTQHAPAAGASSTPAKKQRKDTPERLVHPLATKLTSFDVSQIRVTLNVSLDESRQENKKGQTEARSCSVVVLDGIYDETMRVELEEFLTRPAYDHKQGPPEEKWERLTSDGPNLPLSWGMKDEWLAKLKELDAIKEICSRLQKLYPEMTIALQPPNKHFITKRTEDPAYSCEQVVANAPVFGDSFMYHIDADPSSFPPSDWTAQYGSYANKEPGKPLFVSLILYVNKLWFKHFNAETLFLDPASDCGIFVRPKPYRAILMDQDAWHRISAPSALAQGRARYSIVLKLVFLPSDDNQRCTIQRAEWGTPVRIGAAPDDPPLPM